MREKREGARGKREGNPPSLPSLLSFRVFLSPLPLPFQTPATQSSIKINTVEIATKLSESSKKTAGKV